MARKEEFAAVKSLSDYEVEDEKMRRNISITQKLLESIIKKLEDVSFVKDVGLRWPFRNLIAYTEINLDERLGDIGGQPEWRVTPGIAYMDYYVEVSVATQWPLNGVARPGDRTAVLFLLDLFIDDIFPWVNRIQLPAFE